jgi:hypothetical protein
MNKQALLLLIPLSLFFATCKKEQVVQPPPTGKSDFVVDVRNDYNELDGHYGLYLSDDNGKVIAFRWLNFRDTTHIVVAQAPTGVRYDCTIAKITTVNASGSGVQDTAINLTTYTRLPSGETIQLRDLNYQFSTDLQIQFTNMTSFDSILVPNALTFAKPQASNGYTGQYRVQNTGKIWLRVLINGESHWRFLQFNHANTNNLQATVDATLLPVSLAHPTDVAFPFVAAWQYQLDGIVNLDSLHFYPLGDRIHAPGGIIPVFGDVEVFEPIINDVFNPGGKPYHNFRIRASGAGSPPEGYFYESDRIYPDIPATLPLPAFDALQSSLSTNRFSAALTSGDMDLLSFTRSINANPAINWEILVEPASSGTTTYRLPELPKALSALSSRLSSFDFQAKPQLRAESYDTYKDYLSVVRQRLLNNDPLWQAKAGYVAKGR